MNSLNVGNGYRDKFDDNIDFGIGDNDYDIGNDVDVNYGDYGFKRCATFDPQQ